jgi:hypothetical protein
MRFYVKDKFGREKFSTKFRFLAVLYRRLFGLAYIMNYPGARE